MTVCGVFFFQAEDGIRDLVRSRGLGDVYKRQDPNCSGTFACASGEETSGLLAVIIVPPALTILIFGHCTIAAFRLWRLTRRARHESPDKPPTPLTGNISRSAAE